MGPHDSKPYNPDIANVFYRAGFIENWGRSKVPKGQNEPLDEPKKELLTEKIIRLLRDNPHATYDNLVTELDVSRSTIKRAMSNLIANDRVVRIGGKRYRHWEIWD